jgi:hypothetical protein
MDEKQRERWATVRVKGVRRFVLGSVIAASLCAVVGHIFWWLTVFVWRGESTPHFVREPDTSVAIVVGCAIAGYFQSSRQWRKNEREY